MPQSTATHPDAEAHDIARSYHDYARSMAVVPYGGAGFDWDDAAEELPEAKARTFSEEEEALLTGAGGALTRAGVSIGPAQALRVSTAYACRRVISEDVAKIARRVVRITHDGNGREYTQVIHDHPVHQALTLRPNDWMTPFEFVQYMVAVATFHEAAYALIQRDRFGHVTELLPLLPGTCAPEFTNAYWDVQYRISGYGETIVRQPGEIFVLRGPMADPWRGHSTVDLAREAVGLAAAIEAAQARFHANDLRPSGILTTEAIVSPEQREAIRQAWSAAYGPGGQGGIAVLDQAFKFHAITAEAAKQEVIANRQFQIMEMCRFFRVFPQIIGHDQGSQSYASVEQMFNAHGQHTLQPWAERFEEAATLAMLSEDEILRGYRVDLDMDTILRGTMSDRVKVYKDAVTVYLTPNEIRVREGLDPLPDPAMDRVQLPANNTGLTPRLSPSHEPAEGGRLLPADAVEAVDPPRRPRAPKKRWLSRRSA